MLKKFKNFKGSHPLKFEEQTGPQPVALESLDAGDTFIREGALCMRLSHDMTAKLSDDHPPASIGVPIINLQTGRAWNAEGDNKVILVDAKIVITKYYAPEGYLG